jgi:hypothetical protein
LNLTLERGQTLIQQAGGSVDSYADAWARARVSIQNATDELKLALAEALLPTITTLSDNTAQLLSLSARAVEEYGFWGVAADILVEGLLDVADIIPTQIDDIEELIAVEERDVHALGAWLMRSRTLSTSPKTARRRFGSTARLSRARDQPSRN